MKPTIDEVVKLASCRVYLTASPSERIWNGDRQFHVQGYLPNQDNDVILFPDYTLTWWPRYPKDWKAHPNVYRALEFIRYYPKSSGRGFAMSIQPIPPGRYFLAVPEKWRSALVSREKESADLYAWLVGTHPTMG